MLLSDNLATVKQTIRRADSGDPVTDAVLTCKVFDPLGTLVDSFSLPFFEDDEYIGSTTSTTKFVVGGLYTFDVQASNYVFRRIRREVAREPEA